MQSNTLKSLKSCNWGGGGLEIGVWSAPTIARQCKQGSSSFVPAGGLAVCKHTAHFTVECPNKKLFEDFTQSISRAVSIDLLHNDSPVIA